MWTAVENHMMDDRYKHDSNTGHAEHSLLIHENSDSGNGDTDEENQKGMYSYFFNGSIFHEISSLTGNQEVKIQQDHNNCQTDEHAINDPGAFCFAVFDAESQIANPSYVGNKEQAASVKQKG